MHAKVLYKAIKGLINGMKQWSTQTLKFLDCLMRSLLFISIILENLVKIRRGPNTASLPVDNEKSVSVTSSVGKSSKSHKGFNMWCHYCDKNNHNTAEFRAIDKFKQQKKNKACFEAKAGPRKKSLAFLFLFEENSALKRQLKPEKTASSKRSKEEG
jgi:hypothetical protein